MQNTGKQAGERRRSTNRSFAYDAKNEICRIGISEADARAELAAMTLATGYLTQGEEPCVRYTTENLGVAKRIADLVRSQVHLRTNVAVSSGIRHNATYTISVQDGPFLLENLGICEQTLAKAQLPDEFTRNEAAKTAVVRGTFLAAGSISNPRKNYRAELVVGSEPFSDVLRHILAEFGISANIIPRKDHYVLYLNEGDSVVALLALIGAHSSILKLENVRILKETRNNVNRAVNCETANINKTVDAAMTQINSIHTIEKRLGLAALSDALRETAQLRLEHPEATLQDLCELSGTTKSCMNHRLRKINAIARTLSEGEDGNDLQGTRHHERGRP